MAASSRGETVFDRNQAGKQPGEQHRNFQDWTEREAIKRMDVARGYDASAMANPHFRQLVHNALRWVSSEEARRWACESR